MRKLQLWMFIGIVSLTMLACNFSGTIQLDGKGLPFGNQSEDGLLSPQEEDLGSNAAPSSDPVDVGKDCLAKTWEISGLSDYIMAAIPPDLAAEYNLQYEDTSGQVYFTLTPDGQILLLAETLELNFSTEAFVFSVPVVVKIDGLAAGNYEADGNTLTITKLDTSGLNASAQAFGENLVDSNTIINAIPFTNAPYNTAQYTCQGDVLEMEFSNAPGNLPPLIFQTAK